MAAMGHAAKAAWELQDDDPTYYPTTDNMGEGILQKLITELFRPLLARFLGEMGIVAFVGADQFIYWEKGKASATVAPDVYVMPGFTLPEREVPECWKVWETGVVPSFALEVMSRDGRKDVEDAPERYEALGVKELVVFDPYVDAISGRTRFRVHRRDANGKLLLVEVTNADRIYANELGCFLRAVGEGRDLRLRVATGPAGEVLFPTETERADAERRARERERQSHEVELAKLRAELEALKRQR